MLQYNPNGIRDLVKNVKLLYHRKSPYQTIDLYDIDGKCALFLDDELQFIEGEEKDYHYKLGVIPLALNPYIQNVYIMGGGDGMVAGYMLEARPNLNITLCEIDPYMIELFKYNPRLRKLNKDSLRKCNVVIDDAIRYSKTLPNDIYDMVIADFPSYKVSTIDLYSPKLYSNVARIMRYNGILSAYCGGNLNGLILSIRPFFKILKATPVGFEGGRDSFIIYAEVKKHGIRSYL